MKNKVFIVCRPIKLDFKVGTKDLPSKERPIDIYNRLNVFKERALLEGLETYWKFSNWHFKFRED